MASYSPCLRYRYKLTRPLGGHATKGLMIFVMLNPSTATHDQNDPTIRRCIGFAEAAKAREAWLFNIFGYRATQPKDLWAQDDPVGPAWRRTMANALRQAAPANTRVVCAWGAAQQSVAQGEVMLGLLQKYGHRPLALRQTADGHPAHPLYLPKTCVPSPFEMR